MSLLTGYGSAEPFAWPAWSAQTARGVEFSSRQLEGKVVVVSVWGSWCPSCRKQLPILNSLQNKYSRKKIQVLAFSLDRTADKHREFVRQNNINVPSIYARDGDGLRVVKMLQQGAGALEAVPTVLIYDKRGRLAHRLVGFFNYKQLDELLAPMVE